MKTRTALCLAALLTGLPASAQTIATRDASRIEAGAYAVDPDHTQVMFAVSHLGFTMFRGRFDAVSGSLRLDPKNPAASSVDVAIQASSVDTPVGRLNDELKGDQWLDARKFPEITFRSTRVVVNRPHAGKVTGDLALHGVTRPVTLSVALHGAGMDPITGKYTAGFELSGKIRRSDYGLKTDLPLVGDEVELTIGASFEKKD